MSELKTCQLARPMIELDPKSHVVISAETAEGSEWFTYEPVTITTVLLWIAEGVVSYAAGQALGRILGNPNIGDVLKAIDHAVEELKVFIRDELKKQIETNEVRGMHGLFDSAIQKLRLYDALPDREKSDGRVFLDTAILNATDITSKAKQYGMSASFVFANSTSLLALSLTALARLKRSDTYVVQAKRILSEAIAYLTPLLAAHENSWQPSNRIKLIEVVCAYVDPNDIPNIFWVVYSVDGKLTQSQNTRTKRCNPPDRHAVDLHERFKKTLFDAATIELNNVMANTLAPLRAAMKEWEKFINTH